MILAPVKPWTCAQCGHRNTTVRCRGPQHGGAMEWSQHVARMQARESILPPAPVPPPSPSTCATCNDARWIPPAGDRCIECLANARPANNHARRWSFEEDEIVKALFGRKHAQEIQEQLFRRGFQPRTETSIRVRGKRITPGARLNHPELWTTREICQVLRIKRDIVVEAKAKGIVRDLGTGQVSLFGQADVDRLAAMYPPRPERWLSAPEAAKRLGYDRHHVNDLAERGAIRAVKRGHRWFLDADHIAEIEAEMRKDGQINRKWGIGRRPADEARAKRKQAELRRRLEGTCTAREAAAILRLGVKTVRTLVDAGAIRAWRQGRWARRLDRAHVEELARDSHALLAAVDVALAKQQREEA